ncbi:hypothetical protein [Aeromonas media]|uniref:hypothetical protein n=1 Tax=Aeromonas media TaxID=651 RepID=UPI0038D08C79
MAHWLRQDSGNSGKQPAWILYTCTVVSRGNTGHGEDNGKITGKTASEPKASEQSAEKTLTEIRIEKATLIKENIEKADHGQAAGIYEAAGVDAAAVRKDIKVKEMLDKQVSKPDLPSHTVLQFVAADSVPEAVRERVLAAPDMTVKE